MGTINQCTREDLIHFGWKRRGMRCIQENDKETEGTECIRKPARVFTMYLTGRVGRKASSLLLKHTNVLRQSLIIALINPVAINDAASGSN